MSTLFKSPLFARMDLNSTPTTVISITVVGVLFKSQNLSAMLERLAKSECHQSAEFISIFYGEDVTEEQAQKAEKIFADACPNAEITLLAGGQPVYYYMISAE